MTSKRIIIVSNRLPLNVDAAGKASKSAGGLVSAVEGGAGEFEIAWVGWSGAASDRADNAAASAEWRAAEREHNYHSVALTAKEIDAYYYGLSNASLWPLLHYMQTYARFQEDWFDEYEIVNQKFCDKVLEIAAADDIVWVHDYHLMLLPRLLKEARPELKIGFFLHTPFPSYEVFRSHPRRVELVNGLLGANLIGFHTFGYLRHFRSSVLRLLGLESEVDTISHAGRVSRVGVFPIGINWPKFQETLKQKAFAAHLKRYEKLLSGKKMVLSVERLDYTKGIPQKLKAIEYFLRDHPEMRNNTVFVIIAIPTRETVNEYLSLNRDVDLQVGRINGRYSSMENIPIHFINHSVAFDELCALYSLADAALVTPLMDGMNLVAKEYVACQQNKNGVLILSEFAGAARELFNAAMVNPYDIDAVARAIYAALEEMDAEHKRAKMTPMRERVIQHDAVYWARNFIKELEATEEMVARRAHARKLDAAAVAAIRQTPGKVGLFFDYDGTLCEIVDHPLSATMTDELYELLTKLTSDPRYALHIVSGRDMNFLQEQFKGLPLTLIAEHGYAWAPCGEETRLLNPGVVTNWKRRVVEIFRLYESSTPGSFIEEKRSAVVWHYRKSDPEFGKWKAGELLGELLEVISNLPVEVHHGKKIVEVHSQQVNKGVAVERLSANGAFEKIVCAGDDQTDETMFQLENPAVTSVKIGKESTRADYYVDSPAEFRELLTNLL